MERQVACLLAGSIATDDGIIRALNTYRLSMGVPGKELCNTGKCGKLFI